MGWQGVTKGYKGLQGIKRGYKGLQGVTRGYKGLQMVTGGYKGLQRITKTFFLVGTSLDTFCWFILHKNQRWTNLKFFAKTMVKFKFSVFHKQMLIQSRKVSFVSRTSANTFSRSIFDKHKRWKNFPRWKNAKFAFF